jgi:hypothetical protein
MGISAKEAAERVGMTKAGIIRAIQRQKLSATRNLKGEWVIDPVELFRVYEPVSTQLPTVPTNSDNSQQDRVNVLETQVMMLEQMVADKDETIRKLFDRLEAQQQVTLLLEDKQRRVSWWRQLWQRG